VIWCWFCFAESTRKLYEKKLKEAMAKNTKPSLSDKTYYREERKTHALISTMYYVI